MSTTESKQETLAQINQKILAPGETLPLVTLKNGTQVQTGTVATLLHNIIRYNQGERGQVESEMQLAIPVLFQIGMFDLFTPDEWIRSGNTGRKFVGEKASELLKK